MKKYIVVTGGAGFIGSNLIEKLIKVTSKSIISLDNYSTGFKKNHINNKRITYINGNIINIDKILNKFKSEIDTIFHLGEFSRIAQSFTSTKKCFETNIVGSYNVINFCLKNKIKIVYSATSASLGNDGEDKNLSPYAFSKSNNLNLIINFNKWFGLKYEIIYFYNVYGPRQLEVHNMSAVIGIFVSSFKKKIPLPIVKPGTQTRRFTHVDDVINGCIFAWKRNKNLLYAIINKKFYSIIEIARLFNSKFKYIPSRPGERFSSKLPKLVEGKIVHIIYAKDRLKKYIMNLKKNEI